MTRKKIGIIGGAGYTGGELIRLLVNHPLVEIAFIQSESQAGKNVVEIHADLLGELDLKFVKSYDKQVDLIFLCVAHGAAKEIVAQLPETVKIIDLSADFRLSSDANRPFVYGLPELNKSAIATAQNIANPGCFATSIQLALLPLAAQQRLTSPIHINSTTGSTGAGKSLSSSSHFSWRQNNLSVYKAYTHQHLSEISKSLQSLQANFVEPIHMIPQRGSFTRGILSAICLETDLEIAELSHLFASYYENAPFVHLSPINIDLKQVINTNKCLLYLEKHENQLLIVSIIDNLLKGASGQAVQNMNLLFGFEETIGLKLKPSAF